jgi:hypothetical protein
MHTYKLTLDDILNPLLYDLSTNTQKIAKRKRFFWYSIALTTLIGIGGLLFKDLFIGITFLSISLVYLLLGNWYRRIAYRRSLRRSIKNNYSTLAGSPIHLDIREDHLYIDTETGDASYPYASFLTVNETYAYFFIVLDKGQVLGVPKFSDDLIRDMRAMVADHGIPYHERLNWKY